MLHIILPHALDDSPVLLGEMEFSVELKNFYSNMKATQNDEDAFVYSISPDQIADRCN